MSLIDYNTGKEILNHIPKNVLPFSYCGIDVSKLDNQRLMDLLAWVLNRREGFTFEYKKD